MRKFWLLASRLPRVMSGALTGSIFLSCAMNSATALRDGAAVNASASTARGSTSDTRAGNRLEWASRQGGPSTLFYLGDVNDVLEGRVPPGSDRMVSANAFRFGFEVGSVRGLSSLGEFIAVNGTAYAKPTDPQAADYYTLASGPAFMTTGGAFLSADAQVVGRATLIGNGNGAILSLEDLYADLAARVGAPLCFTGTVHLDSIQSLAIGKAPIHGEKLMEHRGAYYPAGKMTGADVHAFVMGCLAKFQDLSDSPLKQGLKRILYHNPYDSPNVVTSHTHALLLRAALTDVSQITPASASDVRHLLGDSRIAEMSLDVYEIGAVAPLQVAP